MHATAAATMLLKMQRMGYDIVLKKTLALNFLSSLLTEFLVLKHQTKLLLSLHVVPIRVAYQ